MPRWIAGAYSGANLKDLGPVLVRLGGTDSAAARRWERLTSYGIAALVGLGAALLLRGRFGLDLRAIHDRVDRIVGRATPGTLGAMRATVFGIALAGALWEDLPSLASLPDSLRGPMGLMDWLCRVPGYDALVGSAGALALLQGGTCVALALATVGLATRWSVPAGAIGCLLMGGLLRQYTKFYHTGLIPTYLMLAMTFMPVGHGWSLDRILRQMRNRPVPDADRAVPHYAWCRHVCWTLVALPYLFACLSKLRNGGWSWWSADNMRAIVYADALNPMHFDWDLGLWARAMPDWAFAALGIGALVVEGLFPLVLFSRAARWIFPPLTMGLHLGILLLQDVFFFDLIALQLIFLDGRWLRQKAGAWLARRAEPHTILYDADRSSWSRTRSIVRGLDLLDRTRFADFRDPAVPLAGGDGRPGPDPRIAIVHGGKVRRGFDAYRRLAWALPIGWPIAPWLYLPGVAPMGRRIVARAAARPGEARAASASRADEAPDWPSYPSDGPRPLVRRAACAIVLVLVAAWCMRGEFYPVTSWGMYSEVNLTGRVTYLKVLAHHEDGRTTEARLDRWVGAMADSRYRFPLQIALHWSKGHADPLLAACLDRANAEGRGADAIRSFEVQEWEWDYRRAPEDAAHGRLVASFTYPDPGRWLAFRRPKE